MPTRTIIDCPSADFLLDQIRRSNDRWWEDRMLPCPWVFRGVGDAINWTLTPSAWRTTNNRLQPIVDRIHRLSLPISNAPFFRDNECRPYYEWSAAESEALYQFAIEANDLGLEVDDGSYLPFRSPISTGSIGNWPSASGQNIFIAQHHGIPTRLLDWSGNPLVAAYFAASSNYRPAKSEVLCVWALDTGYFSGQRRAPPESGMHQIRLHRPRRAISSFLHSQGGVFTEIALPDLEQSFSKTKTWPTLETVVDSINIDSPMLIGFQLQTAHADRLLTLLDREGINNAMLMPTLDNVCKSVIDRWTREA